MTKEFWIRADLVGDRSERKELVVRALESGADRIIAGADDTDLLALSKGRIVLNRSGILEGDVTGTVVRIRSPSDMDRILALKDKYDYIIVEEDEWNIIPLENMIACFSGRPKIIASISSEKDIDTYLSVLEKGCDGIISDDPGMIRDLENDSVRVGLTVGTVTGIRDIGMGDRVCVDTCTMMVPGEGMLIGSQSSCLMLVQSESENVGYVGPRAFRVNAGAVHSYMMMPDRSTRYLSELRSGDIAAIVDKDGNVSRSAIGRCKIERRPLIMIEVDGRYNIILQNAETVKLVCPAGAISVSRIAEGDQVYIRKDTGGRHFGMRVEETVNEI